MARKADLSASVLARILNRARARGDDYQTLLGIYALERFLHRVGRDPAREHFVLKGAMLLRVWSEQPYRMTRDLDLLRRGDGAISAIQADVRRICRVDVEPDGIAFAPEGLSVEPIRAEDDYVGTRIVLPARCGSAQLRLQIDIGVGDSVWPPPQMSDYPPLLEFPPARILMYPREAVIAEKLGVRCLERPRHFVEVRPTPYEASVDSGMWSGARSGSRDDSRKIRGRRGHSGSRDPPEAAQHATTPRSSPSMSTIRASLLCLAALALAEVVPAQAISLSFDRTIDISSIPLTTAGDLAIHRDLGHLYMSDGASGGQIFRVNTQTGAVVTTHPSATIPGLTRGPDALAIADGSPGASDLFVFSPLGESRGGRMTLSNTLVADFGTGHDATGADTTTSGNLWVASGTVAGGGTTLLRLNPTTGAVQQTVPVVGVTERAIDIAYDPWLDGMWVLHEGGTLRRVDLSTGVTLATFDLNTLVSGLGTISGGIAFNPVGTQLFVARGTTTTADSLLVLDRQLTTSTCTGDATGAACPCGNTGAAGRGCNNSANTGGALLRGFGIPRVSNDFFELRVEGLPASTTCLFYQGTGVTTPAAPFGDGLRCVAGSVIRLATKVAVDGAAVYPTTSEVNISVRGQIPVAGGTRHYQVWYRNAAAFCTASTFNLSNGVSVDWRP